jgi:polar amino acid transport system substrate-binding protein
MPFIQRRYQGAVELSDATGGHAGHAGRVKRLPGEFALAAIVTATAVGLLAAPAPAGAAQRTKPALKPPAIIQSGKLQFCSTIATPPVEYYTKSHVATGTDVQLGSAIAHQLGLKPVWLDVTFSGIIPALQAGHCDLIMSDLYIKPTRLKVVNFIPYMWASESVVVKKGNPSHITGMNMSLCGHGVAANFSTTAVEDAQAQSAKCVKAGKKAITITQFKTPIEALQQLALGRATAFATTTEDGAYYMAQRKNLYQFAGQPYTKILVGIAVNKGDSKLESAVTTALKTLYHDHAYARIFKRFGLGPEELAKLMKDQS